MAGRGELTPKGSDTNARIVGRRNVSQRLTSLLLEILLRLSNQSVEAARLHNLLKLRVPSLSLELFKSLGEIPSTRRAVVARWRIRSL
jgi:hypothetical protein